MEINQLEEILLCFSYKEEEKENADQAFTLFYREYSQLLYFVIRKSLKDIGIVNEDLLTTIVDETFITVYENPLKYTFPNKVTNDYAFKAWIIKIAKNKLFELLEKFYDSQVIYTSEIKDSFFNEEEIEAPDSVNKEILNKALMSLKERDREILMMIYNYYEKGKKTPSEVLNVICNRYGTTKENIRKIKSRSEKKIIEYFAKYSQLKPLQNVR